MHFWVWFLILSVGALAVDNALTYARSAGTVLERLAACGRGSLTIFMLIWGAIASSLVSGLDVLANVTGDPQFGSIADAVKGVIPPQYHPLLPVAVAAIGIWARQRTLVRP